MQNRIVEFRELKMRTVKLTDEGQKRVDRLLAIPACVGCERPLVDGEQVRCGQCVACYSAVIRAEAQGKVKRRDLIREGKMLPPAKGHPKHKNDFTRELSERS